jgi:replicative DNA helicase
MAYPDLPFDLAAEHATLAALLTDKAAIAQVAHWLMPDHFYLEKHAWVYEAILACYSRREPPDKANVTSELERQGRFQPVGGLGFFYNLFRDAGRPNPAAIATYAANVEQTAISRQMVHLGGQIATLGYERGRPLEERQREAEEKVFALSQHRRIKRDFVTLSQVANDTMDWLCGDEPPGLATGFHDLDELLGGGPQPGDLIILAARPGMGKTALALSIIDNVCVRFAQPAQLFSLEMSRRQFAIRLAAMRGGVDVQRIRPGRLRPDEQRKIADALASLALDDVLVDDTPCEHIDAMRAKARRAAAETPPALIVVDYLGLAEAGGENRVQQVGYITRNLKAMAREIGCPVLALSQLSRAVEARASKVPMLSDLRDSGSVEQDADAVLFLHREDYYDPNTDRKGLAELHIAKNRSGPPGVVGLHFDARLTRFNNLSRYQPVEEYGDDHDNVPARRHAAD